MPRTTCHLLIALAAAAGHAAEPAPSPGGYALGQIRVLEGGQAIEGNDERLIVEQFVDSECRTVLPEEDGEPRPVAGSRGDELTLGVRLLACRRSEAPPAECAWSVEPKESSDASCRPARARTSGVSSWLGFSGEIALSLPEQVGVYELSIDCRLGVAPALDEGQVRAELLVGWAAPLVAFAPPHREWYARASCWAAGLGPEHGEADVLEAIRKGLYRYGNEHWRYGYAEHAEGNLYRFPIADTDAGQTTLEYRLEGELGEICYDKRKWCSCPWQALVDSREICNFGDCYTFSHVLHSMAGVMGVGGLRPLMIEGEGNRGFITRSSRSLDPMFAGNVECDDGEICDAYYFGNHSLRLRDGAYHDATFDKLYQDPDGAIAHSRTVHSHGRGKDSLSFGEPSRRWLLDRRGYGGWYHLRAGDPHGDPRTGDPRAGDPRAGDPRTGGSLAGGSQVGAPLRFTGNAEIKASDPDSDELFESLVATLEVELLVAGSYVVEAALVQGEREVAKRSDWNASRLAGTVVSGDPGRYRLRLAFSGEEIYRAGLDGRYTVETLVTTAGGDVEHRTETPSFDHRDFGELAGNLSDLEVMVRDAEGTGSPASLLVKARAEARKSEHFALELRLARGGVTLGYGGAKEDLFTGQHVFEIEMPYESDTLENREPLEVTAVLYDAKLHAISALTRRVPEPGPGV